MKKVLIVKKQKKKKVLNHVISVGKSMKLSILRRITCFIEYVKARTAQDIIPNLQFVKTFMSKFLPIRGYSSIP